MTRPLSHKSEEIQRFLQMMEVLQETPSSIEEKTGISARTINNYIWGNTPLGGSLLRSLLEQFSISVDWLLTGRGEMQFDAPLPMDMHRSGYLVPYFDADDLDLKDAGDVWLLSARAVEGALIKSGAIPGVDYSRLDLFELAKPFVLQRDIEGRCQLVAKAQSE